MIAHPLEEVAPALRAQAQRDVDHRLAQEVVVAGAVYPLAGGIVLMTLAPDSPGLERLLWSFVGVSALLALVRSVLAVLFGRLYGRAPRLWRGSIYALTFFLLAGWGTVACAVLLSEGLSTAGMISLLICGAIAAGIHAGFPDRLGLAWIGFAMVLGPAGLGIVLSEHDSRLLLGMALAVFAAYLLLQSFARYREFWTYAINAVKLRASVEELERVNRELQLSSEQAAAAAATKSRFIANTSHELRTPLHGILGNAELLLASGLSDRQNTLMRSIFEAGKSLLHLVNDVLDLSRVESGQLRIEIDAHDPRRIAASVGDTIGRIAQAKGLEVEVEVDDAVPERVMMDGERYKQILLNLGGNAVKFTVQGKVRLGVIYHPELEPPRLETFVTDTGPGIPPSKQQTIFEDFIQLDSGTDRRYEGSGLGLAICKRLVEAMEGAIGLESASGMGSTFWFSIPVRPTTTLETRARSSGRVVPMRERATMRARILIVDDNAANRDLAVEQVRHLGHVPDAAPGAVEAFRAMERETYDLVLLDCQMPDIDGYEVARRVRAMEDNPNRLVPIVAVTASAMPEERNRCLQAGMDDYVTKPLNLKMLERAIDVWVAGAEAPAPALEMVPTDPLNPDRLAMLTALRDRLGPDELEEILGEFENEAGELCARLDSARAGGDEEALAQVSARLAMLCREMGLDAVGEALADLAAGKAGAGEGLSGPAILARGRAGIGEIRRALEPAA